MFKNRLFLLGCLSILSGCVAEESTTVPTLDTTEVGVITEATASCTSVITTDGNSNISERGVCWSTTPNPTIADDTTSIAYGNEKYYSTIRNLNPSTIYYVRAYAINKVGTSYGLQATFTTKSFDVTTTAPTLVMAQSATCGGVVSSNGDSVTVIARGVCWSTNVNPTVSLTTKTSIGSGKGSISCSITGLTANTNYYVRSYATNSTGTTYGNELSFTTKQGVKDVDGNIYNTVMIGTQVWLVENLKTTKYRDGTSIPKMTEDTQWYRQKTGAYCDYDNIESNSTIYGRLYNWYAVSDSRNIAPAGWHVPSDTEWTTLISYLGGVNLAGFKLKDAGNTYWPKPNNASNESGFTALPGGTRSLYGSFLGIGYYGYWWSATAQYELEEALIRSMDYNYAYVKSSYYSMNNGLSVRCLKDL